MKKYLYTIFLCAFALLAYAQDPAYPPSPAPPLAITAAEYFIDTDPGAGLGKPITLTPGVDITHQPVTIDVNGLPVGIHRLYIRARNGEGNWSLIQVKEFLYDQDFVYVAPPPAPQQVTAAEYFIDTDPGAGQGTAIPVTPGLDLNNVSVAINVNGLPSGTHRLYIRTRNAEGSWGLTQVKEFVIDFDPSYPSAPEAAQNIMAAEYFFDTDPGTGNGIPIAVTPGTDVNDVTVALTTTGLAVGTHRLYLRTKSLEGHWSITQTKEFVVNADFSYPAPPPAPLNVQAAEYFIDTDPGAGQGTSIPITPGIDLSNVHATINTNGLALGVHRLYLRSKSAEGHWSITQVNEFVVSSDFSYPPAPPASLNVVAAEYFIDTDPGVGKGTAIAITPGVDISNIPVTINTSGLSDAFHRLYIRTKSEEGRWSITFDSAFYVGTLVPSWTIDPAGGHDYGNVAVNSAAHYNFTIRNTGDAAVTLSEVVFSTPGFTASFTPGTVIAARGTFTLPVAFRPTGTGAYTAELKIKSSTAGVDSVTTVVRGSGYQPSTPPVLSWVTAAPYSGSSGVNPAVGQPGLFTYKVVYKSADNKAPQAGYPQVGIDLNGDQDYSDIGEGIYNMVKEGNSSDYAAGVAYSYTLNLENTSSTMGYRFFAKDANGNEGNTTYKPGPTVTTDLTDLRLFANDISFSKNNPGLGEVFTVTARITNSTDIPATNVPVKFYQDDVLIGTGIIASVAAHSSGTITHSLSFPVDGFYPIKVWVDESNSLGDINMLNNYAIRPVTVGAPVLPGGINVTSAVSIQYCPQLRVLISGKATYYGTGTVETVAGAEVTINLGSTQMKTTTDANGNYSYLVPVGACGSQLTYTVSVTDFTFTSATLTKSQAIPCPSTSCFPAPSSGGVIVSTNKNPCANVEGQTSSVQVKLKFRESDINNMWRAHDKIISVHLKVYKDGVLVEERKPADGVYAPGNEISTTVSVPMTGTSPVVVRAELVYTYVEFLQIPSPTYHGRYTKHEVSGSTTIHPESNKPDLTIRSLVQTKSTSFSILAANIKCGDAGRHTVKVYDSIPGGASTLIYSEEFNGLAKGTSKSISFHQPGMSSGTHYLKMVIDANTEVGEQDEANNVLEAVVNIPRPELHITSVQPSATDLKDGDQVTFQATIKNTGRATGNFKVGFTAGGAPLGASKVVGSIGEASTITVISDPYTVTGDAASCGVVVRAVADVDNEVAESNESNNSRQIVLGADLVAEPLPLVEGSSSKPFVVRAIQEKRFLVPIRNVGKRDAQKVTVRFTLNGQTIGRDEVALVRVGDAFAGLAAFTHTFATPGNYVVKVEADTANTICEAQENNNSGDFHIRVVDTKQDLEVLSQYISPSLLNPAPGETITLVGTVKNVGAKPSQANVLRFLVDDIQLGSDVPINSLQPGRDTTVEATALYSSLITGVKVMKIVVDPANTADEERENNNEATRTMIVGDAPDLASNGRLTFNPNGFRAGDSVTVSYPIRNKGIQAATAWVRFLIIDEGGGLTALDSVQVTLDGGASVVVSKKMLFSVEKGKVAAEVVNCSPVEFDQLNNSEVLAFSTVVPLTTRTVVNGDLDMKHGLPGQLPGWIGGKLLLGNYDLVINGHIKNFDADHYVVTNGTGKLKIVNHDAVNVFPVGTSAGSSNFVKISNAGTPDHFSVGVLPYVLKQGTSGDTVLSAFVDRTWLIEEETPGGSNATVMFYWQAGDELPLFDRDQSRTAHYTTSWELGDLGMAVTDSIGRYSRVQSGFTSFSPFSVASASGTLPMRLLQFHVALKGTTAELAWKSDDEVNSKHFVVQHSTNGLQFEDIGIVPANNNAGVHTYRFTHPSLSVGVHYYRLKMVDINETFTYSGIKWVQLTGQASMRVYPNPAQRLITVSGLEANGSVRIVTMNGSVVKQLRTEGSMLVADISSLPQGTYVLQYHHQGIQQQVTFIKQ